MSAQEFVIVIPLKVEQETILEAQRHALAMQKKSQLVVQVKKSGMQRFHAVNHIFLLS